MTADVEGDDPELLGERAGDLPRPAQLALRPAVDEHDRRSLRVAPLPDAVPAGAAACVFLWRLPTVVLMLWCAHCVLGW